jgi:hypothetical protein
VYELVEACTGARRGDDAENRGREDGHEANDR